MVVAWGGLPLRSDPASYASMAWEVAQGQFGSGPLFWPPGWPLLIAPAIAALGPDHAALAARLTTAIVGALTVLCVAVLARQTLGEGGAMRWSGWIAALYPPAVLATGFPHAHHATGLCLVLFTILLVRGYRRQQHLPWLLAGLTLGAGALIRPGMLSILPFVALLGLVIYLRTRARRRHLVVGGVLLLGGALLLVAPVLHLNAERGGGYTISTNNGQNVFYGNNPYTPLYKTSHFGQRPKSAWAPEVRAYIDRFAEGPDAQGAMRRETLRYVREEPALTLLRTANRIRAFWGFDFVTARHLRQLGAVGAPGTILLLLLLLEAGGYFVFMVLVIAGLCSGPRLRHGLRYGWLLLALVVGYQLPYALAFSSSIYHFPLIPLLCPLAALAASRLAAREERWLAHPRLFVAVLALLVVIQVEYAYFTLHHSPDDSLSGGGAPGSSPVPHRSAPLLLRP